MKKIDEELSKKCKEYQDKLSYIACLVSMPIPDRIIIRHIRQLLEK